MGGGNKQFMIDLKNYKVITLKHSETNVTIINEIIEIKRKSWSYPYESHLNWIKENINPDDIHFLVYCKSELIGYTTLTNHNIVLNGKTIQTYGVGCVCTLESGKGYGAILMKEINNWFLENTYKGFLLCRDAVIKFYSKHGWQLINNFELDLIKDDSIRVMVYNIPPIHSFRFSGQAF